MDSSAAHVIAKLNGILQKAMHLEVTVFVTGCAEGFPCEFDLSGELSRNDETDDTAGKARESGSFIVGDQHTSVSPRGSVSFAQDSTAMRASLFTRNFPTSRVCDDLDAALVFAEDVLIARADPGFTHVDEQSILRKKRYLVDEIGTEHQVLSLDDELTLVERCLTKLCPEAHSQDGECVDAGGIQWRGLCQVLFHHAESQRKFYACAVSVLVRLFKRESYTKGAFIWNRGSESDSAKILIRGKLISHLDGIDAPELIAQGNVIGELGLVHGMKRLTAVECASESAVLYSLSKDAWESLAERQPRVPQIIYMLVIR
jgi:CRP-like cAMP-binding protein